MEIQPYLFLNGRCQEAIDFYCSALGAKVTMLVHFRDSPEPEHIPPGMEDKVMHATLQIGDTTVMASDGRGDGELKFEASRCQFRLLTKPRHCAFLTLCQMAVRCRCRCLKPSGLRHSA